MSHEPATWREAIAEATAEVPAAYQRRQTVMRCAWGAGLSLRDIAEASGLSLTAVSKIVGPVGRKRTSLDAPTDVAARAGSTPAGGEG